MALEGGSLHADINGQRAIGAPHDRVLLVQDTRDTQQISGDERRWFDKIFLSKHPHLESFVHSPSCVPLRLKVSVYMVVTRFQHVIELHFD